MDGKDRSATRPPGRDPWIAAALVVWVFALYAPVAGFPYIAIDDPEYVTENPFVREGFTGDGLRWAFEPAYAGNWHPLTWLSHMLDVELFGLAPGPHHLMNVLLHALNAWLVFVVLRGLVARAAPPVGRGVTAIGALAAACFAAHPLRLESVAWISERKDLLSMLFLLMALLAWLGYTDRPSVSRYLAALGLFALALSAKPVPVSLPILLLLLDRWPLGRWAAGSGSSTPDVARELVPPRWLVMEKLPFLALALGSAALTLVAQRGAGAVSDLGTLSLAARLANAVVAPTAYLLDTLWPLRTAIFHPYPLEGWPVWQVLVAAALAAGFTGAALAGWRRRPWISVAWFWFVIALLPMIGLVQVGVQARADRYTHLPHLGLFLAAAWGASVAAARSERARRTVLVGATLAALLLGMATTWQLRYWRDTTALLERAIEVDYRNPVAHLGLSVEYLKAGDQELAVAHAREAAGFHPGSARGLAQLGRALAADGESDEALRSLETAARLAPGVAEIRADLGALLVRAGRLEEARSELERALELAPGMPWAHLNLGKQREAAGLEDAAREHYERAIAGDPTLIEAHLALGSLHAATGRNDEAEAAYGRALELAPGDPRTHAFLAAIDLRRGDTESARRRVERLRELDPRLAELVESRIVDGGP